MSLFLLAYLAIYGGAHAYLLSRVARGFHLQHPWPAQLFAFSTFMVLAPILVRVLERRGKEAAARVVAYAGYLWMGFFFLFLSASLALDLLRALLPAAGRLLRRDLPIPEPTLLAASAAIALAAAVYGIFEARSLRVSHRRLESPKIPASLGRIRVVQISDVHLGLMVGRGELRRILDQVSSLQPDLLVSTGDLVDGQRDGLTGLEREFATLHPRLGQFAVLGNHEVFAGIAASSSFTEHAGFRLLRQQSVAVSDFLTVAGVDDPAAGGRGNEAGERELLRQQPEGSFVILLKHRPTPEKEALGLYDLQLSGHVHKGQIFPFNLITRLAYPAPMGLSQPVPRSFLYVSRGTGTWGPPMRVLAPPEITVIDLVPAK